MAVLILVQDIGEKYILAKTYMLVKNLHQHADSIAPGR